MGHYSRTIEFITVSFIYSSLTLIKCPCQSLIHLIPWLSILTAFGQKGQYFLWPVSDLCIIDSRTPKLVHLSRVKRMETWCITIMLLVGFIKISLFRHSQAYFRSAHKRYASAHTRPAKRRSVHPTHTTLHWLHSPISLSFLFTHLSDEIKVAMPWLYTADTQTSVPPWGDTL